jgi:3-hydroxyisobutyrate dehydrogenase-like beta-hydroxyacid dehydrogenase
MSVGFIGLGNIGKPMAMLWLQSSQPVIVYDVAPQAAADLVAAGAKAAGSIAETAAGSDIVGVCVRDDEQVERVFYGEGGILGNARPDTVVAIHSTVKQDSILKWHEAGKARSIHVIDAAVTRSAEPGKFCYMVGGSEALFGRVRPLLGAGGNAVIHAGPVGSAIALKLCNNMLTYAAFIAVHEAWRLAQAFGLEFGLLQQVGKVNGAVTGQMAGFITGRNQLAAQGESVLNAAFGQHATLGSKDLRCALESAKKLKVALPGTQKSEELIEDVFLCRY